MCFVHYVSSAQHFQVALLGRKQFQDLERLLCSSECLRITNVRDQLTLLVSQLHACDVELWSGLPRPSLQALMQQLQIRIESRQHRKWLVVIGGDWLRSDYCRSTTIHDVAVVENNAEVMLGEQLLLGGPSPSLALLG